MRTLNKVMLMGNLAADPEVRTTTTGKKVVQFPLVTNRGRRPHPADENGKSNAKGKGKVDFKPVTAVFHRIIAWEGLGGICERFLKKGAPVYVEGRIENRTYEDVDKKRHYVTEVVARDIGLLSFKKDRNGEQQVMIEEEEKEGEEVAA